MSDAIARQRKQTLLQRQIVKYALKTDAESVSNMFSRFDPNLNMSQLNFSFQLSIVLNINIDVNIIFPTTGKAKYGTARYGRDVYDPLFAFGVLVPDNLQKALYMYLIKHFIPPTQRGYKYSVDTALQLLAADSQILTSFAPIPVWAVRLRKIEAWRTWASFWNCSFWNVNCYPQKWIPIRITDNPTFYGWPDNPNTVNTKWLYDEGYYDHTLYPLPLPHEVAPYEEIFLLTPHEYVYQPVWNVANWNYDVYNEKPTFDPTALFQLISDFKQSNQPLLQVVNRLVGYDRMTTLYSIHAQYQNKVRALVIAAIRGQENSPIRLPQYYAFALEYSYAKQFMQLVNGEAIIQKWVTLGLTESLLRSIAGMTLR